MITLPAQFLRRLWSHRGTSKTHSLKQVVAQISETLRATREGTYDKPLQALKRKWFRVLLWFYRII